MLPRNHIINDLESSYDSLPQKDLRDALLKLPEGVSRFQKPHLSLDSQSNVLIEVDPTES